MMARLSSLLIVILIAFTFSLSARAEDPSVSNEPIVRKKKKQAPVKKAAPGKIRVSGAVDSTPFMENVDLKAAWEREYGTRWTSPGISVTVPAGFGANWGSIYFGASFSNRTRYTAIADGAVFVGAGIGNAEKYVGLEVSLSVVNLDPFGDDMSMNAKLHRSLGRGFGVALGAENALIIAGGGIDQSTSYYLSMSKYFDLRESEMLPFSALMLTVGVGNGRFTNAQTEEEAKNNYGGFGAVGIRALHWLGLSGAWTGRDIDAGISAAPFRSFRLTVSAGIHDAAGLADRPRSFSLTFAYGDSFFSDTFPFFTIRNY